MASVREPSNIILRELEELGTLVQSEYSTKLVLFKLLMSEK